MKVKAILWDYQPHYDGTCNVKIYVQKAGQKTYFKTEINVLPKDWDKKNGSVKKTNSLYRIMNVHIERKIFEISHHLFHGGDIASLQNKTKPEYSSFIEFTRLYILEVQKGIHPIKESTCKTYQSTLKRLQQYCEQQNITDLSFEDININFYHRFSNFLRDFAGCNLISIGKHWKNIKKLMNEALERKITTNQAHREKGFKVHKHSASNKIYLTESEIEKIASVNLASQPALERERDRFIVSYYLLVRYSDSVRLRRENFFEDGGNWYFRNIAQKTNKESVVPVKPVLLDVLKRNDFNLSGDTNQEANRKLKLIAAMAGLNQEVAEGEKTAPKCSFVTTHTARRSAATNLYLQGTSIKIIADLGGWESEQVLRVYLRASGLESAQAAQRLEFFK